MTRARPAEPASRWRARLTAALAPLAMAFFLAAVAGCGSSDEALPEARSGAEAQELFERAVERTAGFEGPLRVALDGQVGFGGPPAQRFALRGRYDTAGETGEFTTMAGGQEARVLLQGGRAWFRLESEVFTDRLPGGARFVVAEAQDLRRLGVLSTPGEDRAFLYLLLGAQGIRARGTDSVDGAPVRTYAFEIDEEAAVRGAPPERREAVAGALRLDGGGKKIRGTAAIDGEGRIRRFEAVGTVDLQSAPLLGSDRGEVRLASTLTGFGEPVEVDPPEQEDVVPLSEVPGVGRLLSSGG